MSNQTKIQENKEYWDVKRSGEKLLWRLSPDDDGKFKSFTPNLKDYNALKSVLGWINRQTSKNVDNNVLFAKLYIYHLTMNIRHYGTTVLNEFPTNDLLRLLDTPLNLFYKSFHQDLHGNQLNKLVEYSDINKLVDEQINRIQSGLINKRGSDGVIRSMTVEERSEAIALEELKRVGADEQQKVISDLQNYKKTFTLDFVSSKLANEVSEALNRFS